MTWNLTPALPKSIHCVSEVYCDLLALANLLELYTISYFKPNQVGRRGAFIMGAYTLDWTVCPIFFAMEVNVHGIQPQFPNKNGCAGQLKLPPSEVLLSPANMSTIYTSASDGYSSSRPAASNSRFSELVTVFILFVNPFLVRRAPIGLRAAATSPHFRKGFTALALYAWRGTINLHLEFESLFTAWVIHANPNRDTRDTSRVWDKPHLG